MIVEDPIEPYREKIRKVRDILSRKFGDEANFLAFFIVLCNEYGEGDAWAGLILSNMIKKNPAFIDEFLSIMKKHNINIDEPLVKDYYGMFTVATKAKEELIKRFPELKDALS